MLPWWSKNLPYPINIYIQDIAMKVIPLYIVFVPITITWAEYSLCNENGLFISALACIACKSASSWMINVTCPEKQTLSETMPAKWELVHMIVLGILPVNALKNAAVIAGMKWFFHITIVTFEKLYCCGAKYSINLKKILLVIAVITSLVFIVFMRSWQIMWSQLLRTSLRRLVGCGLLPWLHITFQLCDIDHMIRERPRWPYFTIICMSVCQSVSCSSRHAPSMLIPGWSISSVVSCAAWPPQHGKTAWEIPDWNLCPVMQIVVNCVCDKITEIWCHL